MQVLPCCARRRPFPCPSLGKFNELSLLSGSFLWYLRNKYIYHAITLQNLLALGLLRFRRTTTLFLMHAPWVKVSPCCVRRRRFQYPPWGRLKSLFALIQAVFAFYLRSIYIYQCHLQNPLGPERQPFQLIPIRSHIREAWVRALRCFVRLKRFLCLQWGTSTCI